VIGSKRYIFEPIIFLAGWVGVLSRMNTYHP